MSYIEKKIDSEEKYRGVIVNVRLDHAALCDGSIVKREGASGRRDYTADRRRGLLLLRKAVSLSVPEGAA